MLSSYCHFIAFYEFKQNSIIAISLSNQFKKKKWLKHRALFYCIFIINILYFFHLQTKQWILSYCIFIIILFYYHGQRKIIYCIFSKWYESGSNINFLLYFFFRENPFLLYPNKIMLLHLPRLIRTIHRIYLVVFSFQKIFFFFCKNHLTLIFIF